MLLVMLLMLMLVELLLLLLMLAALFVQQVVNPHNFTRCRRFHIVQRQAGCVEVEVREM